MNPFLNVICFFMMMAVPFDSLLISYKTWVYSPVDGVICDKGKEQCFNSAGYSPEFTKEYFDQEQIHSSDAAPEIVQFSNKVVCNFESKNCKSDNYGKDKFFEQILFQNTQLVSSTHQ